MKGRNTGITFVEAGEMGALVPAPAEAGAAAEDEDEEPVAGEEVEV